MHSKGWHNITPFELQDGGKLHPYEVLHDVKDGLFFRCPAGDIRIAFSARQQDQTKGLYFLPKRFVIHRLKPLHNVIYVSEFHNELILSDRIPPMQIFAQNRGNL